MIRRGSDAVSTDRAWAYFADLETGLPGGPVDHDTWCWDHDKAVSALASAELDVLFVSGSSRNRDRIL